MCQNFRNTDCSDLLFQIEDGKDLVLIPRVQDNSTLMSSFWPSEIKIHHHMLAPEKHASFFQLSSIKVVFEVPFYIFLLQWVLLKVHTIDSKKGVHFRVPCALQGVFTLDGRNLNWSARIEKCFRDYIVPVFWRMMRRIVLRKRKFSQK